MTRDEIIDRTILREGGFVEHPLDEGGPTKYGITLRTLGQWRGETATREQVADLTPEQAKEIYIDLFWNEMFDEIPSFLWEILFDSCVLHGSAQGIKVLQRALNKLGADPELVVDGRIGPLTQNAVLVATERWGTALVDAMVDERVRLACEVVYARPVCLAFLPGWINRAFTFRRWRQI